MSSLDAVNGGIRVTHGDAGELRAPMIVLALPPTQAATVLVSFAAASEPLAA